VVVDHIRRVADAVGFGHFFVEQMYTVDQAMPGLSRSSIVLLDDPSAAVPPGAVPRSVTSSFTKTTTLIRDGEI
jgi:hypothetical protein